MATPGVGPARMVTSVFHAHCFCLGLIFSSHHSCLASGLYPDPSTCLPWTFPCFHEHRRSGTCWSGEVKLADGAEETGRRVDSRGPHRSVGLGGPPARSPVNILKVHASF